MLCLHFLSLLKGPQYPPSMTHHILFVWGGGSKEEKGGSEEGDGADESGHIFAGHNTSQGIIISHTQQSTSHTETTYFMSSAVNA